jgi:hypothetical protein
MNENQIANQLESGISIPSIVSSYRNAWQKVWKYFLELLLILIIAFLLSLPELGLYMDGIKDFVSKVVSINLILISFEGFGAYIIFAIAYSILFSDPLEYGVQYAFLKVSRNEPIQVKDMFYFTKNYWNTVFANLLTSIIIIVGFLFCIIPGILFACKFAFVSYLVVDKKLDAVAALKESWRMTTGYSLTIFTIGLLAFFICIGGLILCGIGIVFSIIWIKLTFASLYHSVSSLEAKEIAAVT